MLFHFCLLENSNKGIRHGDDDESVHGDDDESGGENECLGKSKVRKSFSREHEGGDGGTFEDFVFKLANCF